MEFYDLIIIGAGPGGYEAALEAAACGKKTALIEKGEPGGTCLNRGCIPTKVLLHSAQLYQEEKTAARFGLPQIQEAVKLEELQSYKEETVRRLREGLCERLRKAGIVLYHGLGRLAAPHRVTVQGADGLETLLEGTCILLAAGAVPALPLIPGADLPGVCTSDELLRFCGPVPQTLLVIGGGVIGMEFTAIYQALGSHVVVLEALDRLLANMDREFGQSLKLLIKKRGGEVHTKARVERIRRQENGMLCCDYTENDTRQSVMADLVLIAAGRRPCTEGLFSEDYAPETERGRIVTDETGATDLPGVYAIGDVTGGIQLAHAASAQGRALVRRLFLNPDQPAVRPEQIPSCVYTAPELASVGYTAEDGKKLGMELESRKYPMSANGKSVLTGAERGFIRLVAEKQSHRLVGAQLMCSRASDLISELGLAIASGTTVEELAAVIRPHPTFSEGITEAARLWPVRRESCE